MESGEPEHIHHHEVHSGNFPGHAAPGSSFIIFGCLWAYNALFRYQVARRQAVLKGSGDKKLNYKNTLFSQHHSGWGQATPVEAIVLIVVTISICTGELVGLYMGQPATMVLHHMMMYFFFGVMGAIKVLQHYKYTVPPSSEYVAFITGNAVVGFILSNHLSGRAIVNRQMHIMVVYFSMVVIAWTIAEIMYNRSVTAALGRSLFFVAQGIWLWIMAVVIHPLPFMHKWDLDDHVLLDVASALGVASIAISWVVAFVMNFIITRRVRNMDLETVNRIVALTHRRYIPPGSKGETEGLLLSDSDYEV